MKAKARGNEDAAQQEGQPLRIELPREVFVEISAAAPLDIEPLAQEKGKRKRRRKATPPPPTQKRTKNPARRSGPPTISPTTKEVLEEARYDVEGATDLTKETETIPYQPVLLLQQQRELAEEEVPRRCA